MNPNAFLKPLLAALLSLGIAVSPTAAKAEIITTDQSTQAETTQNKATIDGFITRADVQHKMQELGLGTIITAKRIALLNDAEARELAQKINALPAGGNFSSLTNNDIIIILLAAILLVLIL
ncbi:MAG: PA2779 family protein [Ferrovum sp.]|nr:PA2779 family protein [Ferrovum sp.]